MGLSSQENSFGFEPVFVGRNGSGFFFFFNSRTEKKKKPIVLAMETQLQLTLRVQKSGQKEGRADSSIDEHSLCRKRKVYS